MPAWILDVFAAIMLVVAALGCGRLIISPPWSRASRDGDIDAAHVLMGVAMAGMLAGGLRTFPTGVWVAVFVVVTAWFAWRAGAEIRAQRARALSTGHHLPHLLHGAAMVYMFAAVSTTGSGAGSAMSGMGSSSATSMGTLRLPTLDLLFVLLMAGWVVLDLDQLSGSWSRRHGSESAPVRSRLVSLAVAGGMPGMAGTSVMMAAADPDPAGTAPAVAAGAAAGTDAESPGSATVQGERMAHGLLDPRVALGCRIAMGVTMALMLVIMI